MARGKVGAPMRRSVAIHLRWLSGAILSAAARAMTTGAGGAAPASSSCSSTSSPSPRFRSWPITAARSLEPELRRMGLKIPADAIDGTTAGAPGASSGGEEGRRSCLSDALVSVGPAGRGGTGSFVSDDGLILTNWHVAYDAVRQASIAVGRDYVEEGFVARSREEELPGPNYEVWITKSCEDVSDAVVRVVEAEPDPLKRANAVRDKMQEAAKAAQEERGGGGGGGGDSSGSGGIRCDVQEMLPNESYVLFTYERLRDVRIAYVPPKSLGNFGGDADNFEWPRHTADFTLLRAYVGPDGEAAEHAEDNVPYHPRSRLHAQKNGAAEGDMVFLLGFPGSTMRYAPTSRLRYADEVAVPAMARDFARKLELIDKYEGDSPEAALKMGTSKKSLANELKRSRGKLVMMRKLGLPEERAAEERALRDAAPAADGALSRLAEIYGELRDVEPTSSALRGLRGTHAGSALLAAGHAAHEFLAVESKKADTERETAYRERNVPFLVRRLGKRLGDIHGPHEAALVSDALERLAGTARLREANAEVREILGEDIESAVRGSKLRPLDADSLRAALDEGDSSYLLRDPFVRCAAALWPAYESDRDRTRALLSERDALFAALLELQREHAAAGETFYPDCNGSLRLSAGHVEGYDAADAVVHRPTTTLAGLLDKAAEARLGGGGGADPPPSSSVAEQFACPERLYERISSDPAGAGKVPVCLLYSTDTVGGNSGSPVMNGNGELVAINFDRQRQGLMNEYKWSREYSRSIGVDVRYILWLIGEYDGALHLVEEMLS